MLRSYPNILIKTSSGNMLKYFIYLVFCPVYLLTTAGMSVGEMTVCSARGLAYCQAPMSTPNTSGAHYFKIWLICPILKFTQRPILSALLMLLFAAAGGCFDREHPTAPFISKQWTQTQSCDLAVEKNTSRWLSKRK